MTEQHKRGFAVMSPEQQRTIARQGGQAAHRKGTAHEFTPEEARVAGQKGGRTVSADRQHMSAIGRKGGQRTARRDHASESPVRPEQREDVAREMASQGGEQRAYTPPPVVAE